MDNQTQVAEYGTIPQIESHTRAFLKTLDKSGGKPIEKMSYAEARKLLEEIQASVPVDITGIDITEKIINEDGLSVKIYIIRPVNETGLLPAFLFYHGGGWILGDFPTHRRLVRDLVVYSGAACVFVEYTRSPDAKFPLALYECYAALKWVAENGSEINIDGKRIAVAGNSAGGNLAAATVLMAKNKRGPEIKFQLLFWPVTDIDFETDSYYRFAGVPSLTRNMMIWFWKEYLANDENKNDFYAAPLKASLEQLKGLPSAMVQVAEIDVLNDEGKAYARKMDEAGVAVTLMEIGGMIHDYGLLNTLSTVPAVQSALRAAGIELKNALK